MFPARILSLIDQNVIDALIELVMDPGGSILAKKRERLVDQVVIVEESAAILGRLVVRDHGVRDRDQRARAVTAHGSFAPLQERQEARLLGMQSIGKLGLGPLKRSGDQLPARIEIAGEKQFEIAVYAFGAGSMQRCKQPALLILILFRADRELSCSASPQRRRQERAIRHFGLDALQAILRRNSERAAERGDRQFNTATVPDPVAYDVALADRLGDHFLERSVGRDRYGSCERAAERTFGSLCCFEEDGETHLAQEACLLRRVEHFEARRDIAFERKLMQQPCAEGMNGLHLEPAGSLERPGK